MEQYLPSMITCSMLTLSSKEEKLMPDHAKNNREKNKAQSSVLAKPYWCYMQAVKLLAVFSLSVFA